MQRSRDFHKFAQGSDKRYHPIGSRLTGTRHARPTSKCLVFPRGIAFAVPERTPMQLVVSSPSITQRGANFLGIFFYLKWSSQWRPRPDRSQEGEVREDLPALEQFREEAFEHSGDYCAQNACQFYYAIDNRPGTPHQAPATARATVDGRGGNSENICPSLQMLRVAAGREGIGSMSQGTNAKAGAAFDEGWSEVMTLCLGIRFVRR